MGRLWYLPDPKLTVADGIYRVSTKVAGQTVWFESTTPLRPAVEAFAAVFFIPALHARKIIKVESPIDELWLAETEKLLPTFQKWWGYPLESPIRAKTCSGVSASAEHSANEDRSGLCFTGGVDSFFSLLTQPSSTERSGVRAWL